MGELWCVHVEGPDDIFPMPSKGEAEKEAADINAIAERESEAHGDDIMFRAVVISYPYSAESHAEGCAERTEEEMLRKLQPDTLRLMFKDLRAKVARLTEERDELAHWNKFVCERCHGVGEITVMSGQTPENFSQDNMPCPDCVGPIIDRAEATEKERDEFKECYRLAMVSVNDAYDKGKACAKKENERLKSENDRLSYCLDKAGLECFIGIGDPEDVADHMQSVAQRHVKENASLAFQLSRADKRLNRMLVAVRNLAGQRDELILHHSRWHSAENEPLTSRLRAQVEESQRKQQRDRANCIELDATCQELRAQLATAQKSAQEWAIRCGEVQAQLERVVDESAGQVEAARGDAPDPNKFETYDEYMHAKTAYDAKAPRTYEQKEKEA